jgi:tetratricopeptide (TPR) repeat protein
MFSPAVRFTILSLALTVACISSVYAGIGDVTSAGEHSKSSVAGSGHEHYLRPDQLDTAGKRGPDGQLAPSLQNVGSHTFPISTRNKLAQQYINQGLNLSYGFNHMEARRAFQEAARLDPALAMAYWGQALVLGPNINAPMDPNDEAQAFELVQKAASITTKTSPRERALIAALEKRYTGKAEQRKANDKAYAEAMRKVHQRFPKDNDIAMLYVESMMDLHPWGYWGRDGHPQEGTTEIVTLTEEVLRRNPRHPGALHMYIHLVEPTSTPERAEKAADMLLTLMPAAGHMIHMPSHIYLRVGRYADAMKSNQLAIAADENYITQCRAQGIYPMLYYPHNIHFLSSAATMDGQSGIAIKSAREAASRIDDAMLKDLPMTALFRMQPYWTLARFGRWEEVLDEPAPPSTNAFLKGSWHYVRGLAFAATEQLQQAEQELKALREIMKDSSLDSSLFSKNTPRTVLSAAPEVLAGEIAAAHGQFDQAIAHLERAVRLEDALIYTEPLEFHFPPRLALGALLLESGRPAEAETVYWEDLRRNRNNGWALYGLMQALREQKKDNQAALIEARFKKAWARADVELNASRFGRQAAKM